MTSCLVFGANGVPIRKLLQAVAVIVSPTEVSALIQVVFHGKVSAVELHLNAYVTCACDFIYIHFCTVVQGE